MNNLAKILLKLPKDPIIRGQVINVKMVYKKYIKQRKKLYEIGNINKLEELTSQPKKCWEHLKKISNTSKFGLGSGNYISKENWLDHFRSLNKKDPALLPPNNKYCMNIEKELD